VCIIHVKYFFAVLAVPSNDRHWWPKRVKAVFYIEVVALDGPYYSVSPVALELLCVGLRTHPKRKETEVVLLSSWYYTYMA
jgi:hypothetical protein